MAGFSNSTQAVYSTVRELVENSLDACEDIMTPPKVDITITSEHSGILRISVADNGGGIAYSRVPDAFGRVFYGNKYGIRQKRGTFGLGVTMAVLYGQITTNSPVWIHTKTEGRMGRLFQVLVDVEKNEAVVEDSVDLDKATPGTTVTIRMTGDLNRAIDRIEEYLYLTTISTPHAHVTLEVDEQRRLDVGPWVTGMPSPPAMVKPHPRAADTELLRRLISTNTKTSLLEFLVNSFQQVGEKTAHKYLQFVALSPNTPIGEITRTQLSRISSTLMNYDRFARPDACSLSPTGKDSFMQSVEAAFSPKMIVYSMRGPSEWCGNSFIVEGIMAESSTFRCSDTPLLYRFANRVPLLYDASEGVVLKAVQKTKWSRYGLDESSRYALFVHLCSTRVPYRAAGKQSVDCIPEIESELISLFRELGRRTAKSIKKRKQSQQSLRKMKAFSSHFRKIVRYGAELADTEIPAVQNMIRNHFEVGDFE